MDKRGQKHGTEAPDILRRQEVRSASPESTSRRKLTCRRGGRAGRGCPQGNPVRRGRRRLRELLGLLGPPDDLLIAMEATGHYWQNLFAVLAAPVRRRAAQSVAHPSLRRGGLARTKTDAIDALGIAPLARAEATRAHARCPRAPPRSCASWCDSATDSCRTSATSVRQLHRLVDLGFPEFTRYVATLDSELASALPARYPTAAGVSPAPAPAGGRAALRRAAQGRPRPGPHAHRRCAGLRGRTPWRRLPRPGALCLRGPRRAASPPARAGARHRGQRCDTHEVGTLLTTIDGMGPQTAAKLVAEVGDITRFESAPSWPPTSALSPASANPASAPSRAGL